MDRIATLLERLEARYGRPVWRPRMGVLEELVHCILSQHTSDANSFRAFEALRRAYPTWEAVLQAPEEELAAVIRSGGLARQKAKRIQAVLARIREDQPDLRLERRLAGLSDAEARAYLMALPGIGPKCAAIVLCFALGRPVLPVDTHVFRVSWRLGLIEERLGPDRAHEALQGQLRPELVYRFHVALIRHGRAMCKAQRPRCADCPLLALCSYGQTALSAGQTPAAPSPEAQA
ncbi:MAG: endonuclease III [Bacteroidota bacterium]|nr:endonuclease III [Bacteroidota bacterium]MDW8137834.1 endonuclease III [Bacteroidota bacterium]